jgi:hypothetical protein
MLQIDPALPELTPAQSLTGWRRELCVELLGEGRARIFLRAVESPSLKATELRHATLFQRVGSGFEDLEGCVAAIRQQLERLAHTAVRQIPSKKTLPAAVVYEHAADAVAGTSVGSAAEPFVKVRGPHGPSVIFGTLNMSALRPPA